MRITLALATVLAGSFVLLSVSVGLGGVGRLDGEVAAQMGAAWRESLHPLFQVVAVLGGSELTTILAVALAIRMRRMGFMREAWVVLALPFTVAIELVYKHLLNHPSPGRRLAHADGPSLSEVLPGAAGASSFPSGHVARTVLLYGLIAFVVFRLARSRRTRTLVLVAAPALVLIMSADRVYLGVHWISDVVGGLLLGGLALAMSIVWLDRVPRTAL